VELDPAVPRPDGPACPRAQPPGPGDPGAVEPRAGGRQSTPAVDQGPQGGPAPPVQTPGLPHRHEAANRVEMREDPPLWQASRTEGGPAGAEGGRDGTPQHGARGNPAPDGTRRTGERRERPGDVCTLLGLGRAAEAPEHQRDPPAGAQLGGRPAGPKAVHAQTRPARSRARKNRRLPEPTGDPRGHIQRWLGPGAGSDRHSHDPGPPPVGRPAGSHRGSPGPRGGDGGDLPSRPGRAPTAPGSSTDPPRGKPLEETRGPRPSGPIPAAADSGKGGRGTASPGDTQCGAVGHHASGSTTRPSPGLDPGSEDEDFLPPLSVIPDLFVPFPGRGGPLAPPRPGRRTGGQLEPD